MEGDESGRLAGLLRRGLVRAAEAAGAVLVDGGTQAGVMALLGEAVAARGHPVPLIGVAPAGRVTYPGGPEPAEAEGAAPLDPNHSHFLLAPSDDWGGETDWMFALAEALSEGAPVVTVLVNGGDIAREEVWQSVRRGWPVVVLAGTGRLADRLAFALTAGSAEPELADILAEGDLRVMDLEAEAPERALRRLLLRLLHPDAVLEGAWRRFGLFDENAKRRQREFERRQRWILGLGVAATLLALGQTQLRQSGLTQAGVGLDQALHYGVLAVPIVLTVLIAAANRFRAGNRWILLRAAAEALKGEIYTYRARAGAYAAIGEDGLRPQERLAKRVEDLGRQLLQTEVNLAGLAPYEGPIPPRMYGAAGEDDGLTPLTPERYLQVRLGDQRAFYEGRTRRLERQLRHLNWLIYAVGGLGTFLAAVGLELWVALTTTLAGAFATLLEYRQVEATLVRYNQTAGDLAAIEAWWVALGADGQRLPANRDRLVAQTEKVCMAELTGWVQDMSDALADLRRAQTEQTSQEEP